METGIAFEPALSSAKSISDEMRVQCKNIKRSYLKSFITIIKIVYLCVNEIAENRKTDIFNTPDIVTE